MKQLKPIGYSLQPTLQLSTIIILEKQWAQKALQIYKKLFPNYLTQMQLNHLKIIFNQNQVLSMFLCLQKDEEVMLAKFKEEVGHSCEITPQIVWTITYKQIPTNTPIDKVQVSIWEQYWGMANTLQINFPATLMNNTDQIKTLMRKVIDMAKTSLYQGYRQNACILLQKDEIILEASDRVQREGKNTKTQHCVMMAMEKLAEQHRSLNLTVSTSPHDGKKRQSLTDPETTLEETFQEKQYFAKDLSLIIAQEPCVMCSMALIHSRIKVVYYSYQNLDCKGGLNEKLQICDMNQLNHKYIVYHDVELEYAKSQITNIKQD